MQHRRQILLARGRVAGGIRLDEIRKILLQIVEHFRRRIVRVGDKAKIDDVFGLFVTHQVRQRRRMRGFVEEMLPQLCRLDSGFHSSISLLPLTRKFAHALLRRPGTSQIDRRLHLNPIAHALPASQCSRNNCPTRGEFCQPKRQATADLISVDILNPVGILFPAPAQ